MNEWALLVDRYACELNKYVGEGAGQTERAFNTTMPIANTKADEFVIKNQALIPIIKSLSEQLLVSSTKLDLQDKLRAKDSSNSGACPKDDLIDAIFETVRGVKSADLVKLLQAFTAEYSEDMVSYTDFLTMIER